MIQSVWDHFIFERSRLWLSRQTTSGHYRTGCNDCRCEIHHCRRTDANDFKDTRVLADNTVEMIEAINNDKEVPVNDEETYDNGVKVIPTYLANPVSVDKENYKQELIDTEYYSESDLGQ